MEDQVTPKVFYLTEELEVNRASRVNIICTKGRSDV